MIYNKVLFILFNDLLYLLDKFISNIFLLYFDSFIILKKIKIK